MNTTSDASADDQKLSLREAILEATGIFMGHVIDQGECAQISPSLWNGVCNTGPLGAGNADTINFDAAVFLPSGSIQLAASLPELNTGFDKVDGSNRVVEVNGASNPITCFTLSSAGNTVQYLTIDHCQVAVQIVNAPSNIVSNNVLITNSFDGLQIIGSSSANNVADHNSIGVDGMGNAGGNSHHGVFVNGAGSGNTIGPLNVISGNTQNGIEVRGDTPNTQILSNYIGLNFASTAVPNGNDGVHIDASTGTHIGGDTSGGNFISGNVNNGIEVTGGSANAVNGNFIGTNAQGTLVRANGGDGILISDSAENIIGDGVATSADHCTGACNLVSGNKSSGIEVRGGSATGNSVLGNFVGTDASGSASLPNSLLGLSAGVLISGADNNQIGIVNYGNLISGNARDGVEVSGADGTSIRGNRIGVNALDTGKLANAYDGLRIYQSTSSAVESNQVGGNGSIGIDITAADGTSVQGNNIGTNGAGGDLGNYSGVHLAADNALVSGNNIAFNDAGGIVVFSGAGNKIEGNNSFFSNTGLAIDLGNDGVTLNDSGDGDSGPNDLQNFPVLASAVTSSTTTVSGTLDSTTNTQFDIDFFSSPACDSPDGNGEGKVLLGSLSVTTTGNDASFTASGFPSVSAGQVVTATAKRHSAPFDTSEFSSCVTVTAESTATPTTSTHTPTSTSTHTPTPTPTPTSSPTPTGQTPMPSSTSTEELGNADCQDGVTVNDALTAFEDIAGLATAPCEQNIDVNCDGEKEPIDVLNILRFVVSISRAGPVASSCRQIGM